MPTTIKAAVMDRTDGVVISHKIAIEEMQLETPRAGEVAVLLTSCGVCGTDRGCIHGAEPVPTPCVLGHEGAGIVEDIGTGVTQFSPGDRVILGFPSCGVCRQCVRGQPHYCAKQQALLFSCYRLDGSTPLKRASSDKPVAGRFFQQSSWATHTLALEQQLVKVPMGADLDLFGPLGCSVSTGAGTVFNELRPRVGTSIAVFGCGTVGLCAIMAARLQGCTTIIAIDQSAMRLATARELGATHTINTKETSSIVAAVKDLTHGELDYSVESTLGAKLAVEAVEALGILGTCALVGGGTPTQDMKLKHEDVLLQGKRIIGAMGGGGQSAVMFPALIALQMQGKFPLEKLVRYYPFEQINQALDDCENDTVIKPILKMVA